MASGTKSIIIGSTPVFRGKYSPTATYYRENVITYCACVFKAVANNFSNVPPLLVDADGKVSLTNTSVWTCILDNTRYYNATGDFEGLNDDFFDADLVGIRQIESGGMATIGGVNLMVLTVSDFERIEAYTPNVLYAVVEDND